MTCVRCFFGTEMRRNNPFFLSRTKIGKATNVKYTCWKGSLYLAWVKIFSSIGRKKLEAVTEFLFKKFVNTSFCLPKLYPGISI